MGPFWDKVRDWVGRIKAFLLDAKAELKKVTWPTRKQALASTMVVIVVVFVVSIFLGLVDFGLVKLMKLILG
ncbi:MAG TPA: preprotein translocase subunit SecE [Syntrophales bacterium]|nr:preprotein translocase subunit SecE [Syntrophales bacterium]HOL58905.1 preprotein translocase subunit SecE [Syntrophales bacterium]HPO35232.1 preprotein translocase subunit SecE [Syntrophales bacterium]